MLKIFNDADKAKKYIIKEIMPNFSDGTFSHYISTRLAGDFACNLAEAWDNRENIEEEEKSTPIQNALYSTGKFTTEQCSQLTEGILLYLDDANIRLSKK